MLPALLVLLVFSGCTHTRAFHPAWETDRAAVNERAENRAVIIETEDGERFRGTGLWLYPDTATWMDQATGEARQAPLGTLRSVRVPAPGRGAVRGALIGLPIGVAYGVVAAQDGGVWATPGTSFTLKMTALSAFGSTLVGAVAGYASGWLRYEVQRDPSETEE